MLSISAIVSEIAERRGSLKRTPSGIQSDSFKQAIADEYLDVWMCFNRYASSVLAERKTMNITNFCKIGWIKGASNTEYKPYFSLADSFVQAFSLGESGKKLINTVPTKELAPIEELNFSKAAIRYSNGLTKDQVFTGLRFIVQALGKALASNRNLSIDFDCGRLSWASGKGTFAFNSSVYSAIYKETPRAPTAHATENSSPAINQADESPHLAEDDAMSVRSIPRSVSSRASSKSSVSVLQGRAASIARQELAYREALNRHLNLLEYRAGEAIKGRQDWESHIYSGLEQEADEFRNRRKLSGEVAKFVSQQILWNEAKKSEERHFAIAAASSHDFPAFSEPPESVLTVKQKQKMMRGALDTQVRMNAALKDLAKEKERQIEEAQRAANLKELESIKSREEKKRLDEKRQLAESWNREVKIKHIWKAIEDHATVPAGKSPLLDALNRSNT